MSSITNFIATVRKRLGIPEIEEDIKAFNATMTMSNIEAAKAQAAAHNEKLQFADHLLQFQHFLSASSSKFEAERRRNEDAEKKMTIAISTLANRISKLETLVSPPQDSTGDQKDQ